MELWERSDALALLEGARRETASEGRVVVVAGEAGIGKSALVAEFARLCAAHAQVMRGACDPLVTARVLGPFHDIGRQVGGSFAARLGAGASREEIFAAFLDELCDPRRRRSPVVVVEDAHWADDATLDLLAMLGRRIAQTPALLVVTYRDETVGADHPLRGALASMPSALVRRIRLPPLSPGCVAAQARRLGRDAEAIHQLAGGNPLLVTELLKSDGGTMPGAVEDLILDRIRALPEPARELAHLVSVVPTRADAAIVAEGSALVGICLDGGVLVSAEGGVAFRHELLRRAVENSLSSIQRVALHRRVLELLDAVAGVDPGRVMHHARMAGDESAILKYGRIAGSDAARQGARREAAAHYRAAAAYADRLPPPERARLFEAYSQQAGLAGSAEEGLHARQQALAMEQLGQLDRVGENLCAISRSAWWAGRREEAWAAAARAVEVLEREGESRALATAYNNLSQLHMVAYHTAEAIAWGERAHVLADRLGDVETALDAMINVHSMGLFQGSADAASGLRDVHERAAGAGLVEMAGRAVTNLASETAVELAEYRDAVPLLDWALEYTTANKLDPFRQFILASRATIRVERGEWTESLADIDDVLAQPVRSNLATAMALCARGRIQSARGDPEALATLDEADAHARRVGEVQLIAPVAAARSEYFLWAGDLRRAVEEARSGLDLALPTGLPVVIGQLAYRLWKAGGLDNTPATAAGPYQLAINGDWRGAATAWERRDAAYLRADALAEGDETAASEALQLLDRLGAARVATYVRARLRRRGFSRVPRGFNRATAANPASLTRRQLDVLALLAQGLSNAQIAERLWLSAKTVDHHVSAVLGKLGVSSRREVASAAARLDLNSEGPR